VAGELLIGTDRDGVDHAMTPEEGVLCPASALAIQGAPWANAKRPCPRCTEIVEARTGR
jgi:hypothetical protein